MLRVVKIVRGRLSLLHVLVRVGIRRWVRWRKGRLVMRTRCRRGQIAWIVVNDHGQAVLRARMVRSFGRAC